MKKNVLKKVFASMLTGALILGLSACGTSGSQDKGESSDSKASVSENVGEASSDLKAPSEEESGGDTFKVGIVQYVDDASLNQIETNIEKELDAKALELGVTFDYADYTYNGQADGTVLNQIASELIADDVDIIVPIATPTAQIMQSATEDEDIPIVYSAVSDPVGSGLAESMETPGMNMTGTSDALNTRSVMDMMFSLNPDIGKVGLLYSKSESSSEQPIADAKAYLDEKGIDYVEKTGTNTDEVSTAADALIAEGVDVIFTPTDNTVMTAELSIYEKIADAGIAHYCGADSFALNGAFCGYGVDYANLGAATADMVADILVNEKDAGSMPVQTFDNGIATVNTEIADMLKISMDDVNLAFSDYCTSVVETVTAEEFED